MKWITLKKYSIDSGMTTESVRALIKKGKIRQRIHWIKTNGRIFINSIEMERWIETSQV